MHWKLPDLLRQFPKLHWLLVGDGNQLSELEDRAKNLSIYGHVRLVGYQENLLPYYAAATVYLRTIDF